MHSVASLNEASTRGQSVVARRVAPLVFLLSLLVLGLGNYLVHHEVRYALAGSEQALSEMDLSEIIGESDRTRQVVHILFGMTGVVLLLRSAPRIVIPDRTLISLITAITLLITISCIWSDEVALSLKRSFIPLLTLFAALGFAKHLGPQGVLRLVFALSASYLIIGLATEIRYGVFFQGDEYRFAGTLHPNRQAVNCAMLCLAALAMRSRSTRRERFLLVVFCVGLVMLFLTKSRSGFLAFGFGALIYWLVGATALQRAATLFALVTLGVCASILIWASEATIFDTLTDTARMGREQDQEDVTSLTGRVPIWIAVSEQIGQRPIFGYGYGAFWTTRRVVYFSSFLSWEFDHAHSVYLETLLNIGAVGLILGLMILVIALIRAAAAYHKTQEPGFRFSFALLAMGAFHGLVDTIFIRAGFGFIVGLLCVSMILFHGNSSMEDEG